MPPATTRLERALALAARQHGLITAGQCRELGISRNTVQRLIANGTWAREAPGVYRIAGTSRTWEGRPRRGARGRPGPLGVPSERCVSLAPPGVPAPGRIDITVPDTEFARLFLRLNSSAGLPEPRSEMDVSVGGRAHRLDCAYPRWRIAIELDGRDHLRPEVYDRDRVRDNQLELAGWLVLRFTWRRFSERPDEVVAEVRAAIGSRRGD